MILSPAHPFVYVGFGIIDSRRIIAMRFSSAITTRQPVTAMSTCTGNSSVRHGRTRKVWGAPGMYMLGSQLPGSLSLYAPGKETVLLNVPICEPLTRFWCRMDGTRHHRRLDRGRRSGGDQVGTCIGNVKERRIFHLLSVVYTLKRCVCGRNEDDTHIHHGPADTCARLLANLVDFEPLGGRVSCHERTCICGRY